MPSRYLLDTNVVSELVKRQRDPNVMGWLQGPEGDHAYICAVTVGEIQAGISLIPPSNRRTQLEIWLNEEILQPFADRILPVDKDTFLIWGQLHAQQRRRGQPMSILDSMIAAVALQHRMILVTRNVADFAPTGLSILNPWE